jgi:hypothetical protein
MKDIDHKSLLCDEDPLLSSPTSPKQVQRHSFSRFSPNTTGNLPEREEEREELLMDYLRMEKHYTPCDEYLVQLEVSTNLRAARSKAIQYIIDVRNVLDIFLYNVL